MKVSAATEYGCIAMLELATQYGSGEPVRIHRIVERHGVPVPFLSQILLQLKEAGLVSSVRGAAGGYLLMKPPREVSLGQVMEAISDRPREKRPVSHASPDSSAAKVLQDAWQEVASVQREMLDGISLAELLERSREQDEKTHQT